jgi:hypothetical protein
MPGFWHRAAMRLRLPQLREQARAFAQPVTYLGVAMLAMTYCVLVFLIVNDRIEAEANAKRQGDNLVRIIEQSYSHIFQSVDSSLQSFRRAYQRDPSAFDAASWIGDTQLNTELAFNFVVVNAQGRIVNSTSHPAAITTADIAAADIYPNAIIFSARKALLPTISISVHH